MRTYYIRSALLSAAINAAFLYLLAMQLTWRLYG